MSSRDQAWDQFLGGPSAAEFENPGVFYIVESFLDVPIDIVLEVLTVFSSGCFVIF